jgi:heme/copper-type cytochrome/quinol oxidase subunit 2
MQLDDAGADNPEGMEITVYGQQWWWAYEYDLDPEPTTGLRSSPPTISSSPRVCRSPCRSDPAT